MTATSNAATAYRQAAFENAPPLKILRLLYQGALRFLNQAREADPTADAAFFNERLSRADAVVVELRCCLDDAAAPEMCKNLENLYFFVEEEIRSALSSRKTQHIDNATHVLTTLLDGWKKVEVEAENFGA